MRRKLLIVDDEPVVRAFMERVFEDDFQVLVARDGEEALLVAERERPDVALLDVWMPNMNGMDLLKGLKQIDPSLTIFMISAENDPSMARATMNLGAADYLDKPMDKSFLINAVRAHFCGLMAG